jgi:ribonuclease HI
MNSIDIFIDGSIDNQSKTLHKKHLRKAGYAVYIPAYDIKMSDKFPLENPTNNRAEYYACIKAMEWVIENNLTSKNIQIYTDCELLIKSLTVWLNGWIKRGWKKANGDPVLNIDMIKILADLKNKLNITFIKVKAHEDEPLNKDSYEWYKWKGNDIADTLAKQGRFM